MLLGLLVARSQVGGDQLNLLARGWLLAARHRMVWFGNPLSTGGKVPGGLSTLLVGLPLLLWRDHRAPTLLVALTHVAAWLLLDRTLARILASGSRAAAEPGTPPPAASVDLPAPTPRIPAGRAAHAAPERLLLAVLYWLSPWQLYFAGFLWNPNYLFLAGALHLATAWRLRRAPRPAASLVHVATLVLGLQVHPSCLLLVAASALLAWRGYLRLHLGGALLGVLAGALPLLPWAWEALTHPALLAEAHKGFPGRGLLFSLPRGALYWLRYSSLSLAGRTSLFDFSEALGAAASRRLTPVFRALTEGLGPATVLLPLVANLWLWRRQLGRARRPLGVADHPRQPLGATDRPHRPSGAPAWRRLQRRPGPATPGRVWLRGYVLLTFLAALAVFAVSPTTFMYWQGLCLFHAAVLPLVLYAGALLRTRRARLVAAGAAAWSAVAVLLTLGIAFGTPDFRCRGRDTVIFPLRSHSPMLTDLHIQQTCPWPTDVNHAWWPDVLPEGR